jgi:arylsulfatase A-like enzyme
MKMNWIVVAATFLCFGVQAQQTNVLLIIADDLGIDSLAAFNDDPAASLWKTPTIDNIQSNGITFTRYYAYSTCSPTRGSMMTGRYAFRTGVLSPNSGYHDLQLNDYTLPEALLDSGVISNRLAHVGKWHLGSDADAPNVNGGWPHFSGGLGGGVGDYYNWSKVVNGVTTNTTVYATTENVNDAVEWIGQQGTNSWFLWLAFNAPHTPFHRPPNALHTKSGPLNNRGKYEAMVEAVDTEMARLLSAVDLTDTTVIFMGDNGTPGNVLQPPLSAGHGKGSIYDGGIRVPLLVYGAAVSNGLEGTTYDGVVHSVDMYATILDLFDIVADDIVPEELVLDSRSFAGVLRGESYQRTPSDIMALNALNEPYERAIVAGDYKYIDFGNGTQEFYNVASELVETNNLLDGALSPIEQTAYESLTNKLETYINVPHCYSTYMTNGTFNVEIGWFDNEGFTLCRTDDLVSNNWNIVAGQEFENNGTAALILRDTAPPASNAFYRVTTP